MNEQEKRDEAAMSHSNKYAIGKEPFVAYASFIAGYDYRDAELSALRERVQRLEGLLELANEHMGKMKPYGNPELMESITSTLNK